MKYVTIDKPISAEALKVLTTDIGIDEIKYRINDIAEIVVEDPEMVLTSNSVDELRAAVMIHDLSFSDRTYIPYSKLVKVDLMNIIVALCRFLLDNEPTEVLVTTSSADRGTSGRKSPRKSPIKLLPATAPGVFSKSSNKLSPQRVTLRSASPLKVKNNTVPTNVVPTNVVPTNVVPTNVVPTNVVPTTKLIVFPLTSSDSTWEYLYKIYKELTSNYISLSVLNEAKVKLGANSDNRVLEIIYEQAVSEYNNSDMPNMNALYILCTKLDIKLGKRSREHLVEAIEFKALHRPGIQFDPSVKCCKSDDRGYSAAQYKAFMNAYGLHYTTRTTKAQMHSALSSRILKGIAKPVIPNKASPKKYSKPSYRDTLISRLAKLEELSFKLKPTKTNEETFFSPMSSNPSTGPSYYRDLEWNIYSVTPLGKGNNAIYMNSELHDGLPNRELISIDTSESNIDYKEVSRIFDLISSNHTVFFAKGNLRMKLAHAIINGESWAIHYTDDDHKVEQKIYTKHGGIIPRIVIILASGYKVVDGRVTPRKSVSPKKSSTSPTRLSPTRMNSSRMNSSRLSPTRMNSSRMNSSRIDSSAFTKLSPKRVGTTPIRPIKATY